MKDALYAAGQMFGLLAFLGILVTGVLLLGEIRKPGYDPHKLQVIQEQ